jgi:hypothetical protein
MTKAEFLKPWKVHLAFGVPFLALLAFNIIYSVTGGAALGQAIWEGFAAVKPMEYLMYLAFWYAVAFCRFETERRSELTTLNLGRYHK